MSFARTQTRHERVMSHLVTTLRKAYSFKLPQENRTSPIACAFSELECGILRYWGVEHYYHHLSSDPAG